MNDLESSVNSFMVSSVTFIVLVGVLFLCCILITVASALALCAFISFQYSLVCLWKVIRKTNQCCQKRTKFEDNIEKSAMPLKSWREEQMEIKVEGPADEKLQNVVVEKTKTEKPGIVKSASKSHQNQPHDKSCMCSKCKEAQNMQTQNLITARLISKQSTASVKFENSILKLDKSEKFDDSSEYDNVNHEILSRQNSIKNQFLNVP